MEHTVDPEPTLLPVGEDGRKMSKRFGNVVNPDQIVDQYGADTLRIYEMFMGPFTDQISWNTSSMIGSRRFLERVYKYIVNTKSSKIDSEASLKIINKSILKISNDINELKFNTAISTLMITLNELEKINIAGRETKKAFVKLLAPFAPHITEEMWKIIGEKGSIHTAEWPKYDPSLDIDDTVTIVLQINGKTRGSFMAKKDENDDTIRSQALTNDISKKWLEEKSPKKVIVIKNRLVNILIDNQP
jgi:leucyl-tRNA synthetase